MNVTKALATAALITALGATAGCGGKSSSGSSNDGAAGSPTDADQKTFCSTLQNIPQDASPKEAVAKVQAVGTPSGIDAESRTGYETLLDTLSKLPDNAKASDFSAMQKNISAADKAKVQAFFTYFVKTCQPAGAPSPTTP
ncbi:MAG: hypothetical protein ACR2K3_02840 [Nocardioides sp.]